MLQCSQPSKMPLAYVQDGFPQQRGWPDRFPELSRLSQPNRFSARSHSLSLKPRNVAAGASSRTMKIETLSIDFTDEQKRYLEGFTSGLQINRAGRGLRGGPAG